MDPLKYYNFKNTVEITEMATGEAYHFRAIFNGGFVSGTYSFRFNAIVPPIFGEQLTDEEISDITEMLKHEIEELRAKEDKESLRIKQEDELRLKLEKELRRKRRKDE